MQEDLLVVLDLIARSEGDAAALYEVLGRGSPVALHRLGIHPHVRRHLAHPDATVRAAATTFLPRLWNAAAVPYLIERLEDDDAPVRAAALASLRTLSGMALGPEPSAWETWTEAETQWRQASALADRLRSDDPVEVSRALRELAQHPLAGAGFGVAAAELVQHEVVGIRLLACATLRGLKAPQAAIPLVDGLWDDDPAVRQAVWQVLRQLSGETLPLDGRAWAEARRRWKS
ncbi:MAG: HEAT repeat domain-containing protein, partial [Planctomycetota bacterium]|jgi:HEAT repeat protein